MVAQSSERAEHHSFLVLASRGTAVFLTVSSHEYRALERAVIQLPPRTRRADSNIAHLKCNARNAKHTVYRRCFFAFAVTVRIVYDGVTFGEKR
jgi:hypothetical protein